MDDSFSFMKARDDPRHLSSVSNLEEHMRNLEDTEVEKKDKRNPLVVRLLLFGLAKARLKLSQRRSLSLL
jgi:hypothetical protein